MDNSRNLNFTNICITQDNSTLDGNTITYI